MTIELPLPLLMTPDFVPACTGFQCDVICGYILKHPKDPFLPLVSVERSFLLMGNLSRLG